MRNPNSYERAALRQIAAFRAAAFPHAPHASSLLRARPRKNAGSASFATRLLERVGGPLGQALGSFSRALSGEGSASTAFRAAGYPGVTDARDIEHLSLHEVDRVASALRRRHLAAAAALGAGAGAFGAAGMLVDLPAMLALSLRVIGDHACHYGFALDEPGEQAFVLDVLSVAAAPTLKARRRALEHATSLVWSPRLSAQSAAVPPVLGRLVARRAAQAIVFGLGRARLGRWLPLLGAAASAALNASFVSGVVDAASMLYRERFLLRRCGPAMVALCEAGVEIHPGAPLGHRGFLSSNAPLVLS